MLVVGPRTARRVGSSHDEHRALGDRHRLGRASTARLASRDVDGTRGRGHSRWVRSAWLSGYVVLPLAKVYKPIWDYDARTLGERLSAHLVYGAVVSAAFAALTKEEP